jgi:glycerophosphoryl diester phosphodiesterase
MMKMPRMHRFARWMAIAALSVPFVGQAATNPTLTGEAAIVIAHRGASGYLPEHTLAAYELAARMGATYIEPDLQLTNDGVLVAMHDDTLGRTTNVAALYAPRNGGYKVADFTLAEIKTLTVQPVGTASTSYPGYTPSMGDPLKVPTFQEVIDLARQQSQALGREVGIYPEAKQADPLMENLILSTLIANGYGSGSKVFVQSFSDATIRSIDTKQQALGVNYDLVLLGAAVTLPNGLAQMGVLGANGSLSLLSLNEVATFASGIGVVINYAAAPITADFIAQAHAAGLLVHGWTFSTVDPTLAAAEFQRYLDMGMDGVFANYPDLAVSAVSAVPEPSVAVLMAVGGFSLLVATRRRRTTAA